MELLPLELRQHIPKLYRTRHEADPTVWAKFFSPVGYWCWCIIEVEKIDNLVIFYGWMVSSQDDPGRFIRSDLASMRAYFGITIEYDPHFTPDRLSEVQIREGS